MTIHCTLALSPGMQGRMPVLQTSTETSNVLAFLFVGGCGCWCAIVRRSL